jgi:sporulation protein YlmC with PRC-barrel domain
LPAFARLRNKDMVRPLSGHAAGNPFPAHESFMEEDMLKKHMAACLVTTALLAAPALAQTSSSSGSGASSAAASSGKFLTEEKPNQWRASKLVGINVYGPNNEKIGDINEVLVDRNGKAEAVVIGVGGFLGIGEKDVAIPFDQVRWSDNPNEGRSAASTGTGTSASGGAASGTAGTAGTAGGAGMAGGAGTGTAGTGAGATTGSTGSTGSTGANRTAADRGYPDHAMISMTKDELKGAPSFRYAGSTSRDNNASGGSRSGAAGGSGSGGASGMGGSTGAGTAAPGSTAPRQ